MKNLILGVLILTGLMAIVSFIFGDFLRAAFYVILTGINHWSYNRFKLAEEIRKDFNEKISKLDKKINKRLERAKEILKELEKCEKELKELEEDDEKEIKDN